MGKFGRARKAKEARETQKPENSFVNVVEFEIASQPKIPALHKPSFVIGSQRQNRLHDSNEDDLTD